MSTETVAKKTYESGCSNSLSKLSITRRNDHSYKWKSSLSSLLLSALWPPVRFLMDHHRRSQWTTIAALASKIAAGMEALQALYALPRSVNYRYYITCRRAMDREFCTNCSLSSAFPSRCQARNACGVPFACFNRCNQTGGQNCQIWITINKQSTREICILIIPALGITFRLKVNNAAWKTELSLVVALQVYRSPICSGNFCFPLPAHVACIS